MADRSAHSNTSGTAVLRAVRFESTVRALRLLGVGAGDPIPWAYEVFADNSRLRLVGRRHGTFFEIPATMITRVEVGETQSGWIHPQVELAVLVQITHHGVDSELPLVPVSDDGNRKLTWQGGEVARLSNRLAASLGLPDRSPSR